jgi:hypothetical protein
MRIRELMSEQTVGTIGTTGSTAGAPAPLQPVSQPSTVAKPPAPGTPTIGADPNMQKLAATLKQNKVVDNEQEVNDFIGAYQAQQSGKTLNPAQQGTMANLANAMLKNRSLSTNLDLQLKATAQQKPGTAPVQKAPGGM